jgi:hypothetical protein
MRLGGTMNIDPSQHEDAIDDTFAALRDTVPPEGMDSRIAARIAQQVDSPAAPRLPSQAPSPAWWRGAITGAVTALLIVCAILMAHPGLRNTSSRTQRTMTERAAAQGVATGSKPANMLSVSETRARPCSNPAAHQVRIDAATSHARTLRYASLTPSHPAPALPLTSQERALVQLAKAVDPKVLASLNSEAQAKLQAKNEADFDRFFNSQAPSVPPTDSE